MLSQPTTGRITSPWGMRTIGGKPNFHSGLDYAGAIGSMVKAVLPGKVQGTYPTGRMNRYGNAIVIRHAPDLFSLYAHLDSIDTTKGAEVLAGQPIATIGRTGGTRDDPGKLIKHAHLHFEFLDRWPPRGIDLDRIDPFTVFNAVKGQGGKPLEPQPQPTPITLPPPLLPPGPYPHPRPRIPARFPETRTARRRAPRRPSTGPLLLALALLTFGA